MTHQAGPSRDIREGADTRRPAWLRGGSLSGRQNSFGAIRTALAVAVVYSHAYPLGWGRPAPLSQFSGGQIDLGRLAVVGFFALSGFMITGSAMRSTIGRYSWHRALRILPGLWVSLLVSVLVVAPALYYRTHHSLTGYWSHPTGPLHYLAGAWNASFTNGWDISNVVADGVAAGTNHDPGLNGSLWSLDYEMLCYIMMGLLAAGGVLLRAKKAVPLLTLVVWILIVEDWRTTPGYVNIPNSMGHFLHVPVFGQIYVQYFVYLGFVFLLGATVQLYKDRIPMNAGLALLSAAVLVASLHYGGLFAFGYPAFAYLLFWLAVRLPVPFQRIGVKRDLSYGIYIYGFTVEQVVAALGYNAHGMRVYLPLSLAGTVVLAALSWYLVEKPALKAKDWTPRPVRALAERRARGVAVPETAEPVGEPARSAVPAP
ncbi:acyltransferase [Kitasatospora sp. NPDC093102]|uniref:acyltransferase family protein n=1 Tax=Kitasatospora sp. NPDC093102 TaxID=3155069 RepID=UPI0034157FF4